MDQRTQIKQLVNHFSQENLVQFFRTAHDYFRPIEEPRERFVEEEPDFLASVHKVGEIELEIDEMLIIYRAKTQDDITHRTSRKRQYDLAKKILKEERSDAGIFVFHDERGHFRFSLVVTHYDEAKQKFTPFRRYTYYVTPDKPNKTFINQIGKADFSGIDSILKAFSIEEVSEEFYKEFKPHFDEIAQHVQGNDVDEDLKQDFALLFIIRIIFLGFVQKKKWLGEDEEFLQKYWEEYKSQFKGANKFYARWLKPLFFDALNSKPGTKVKYQNNEFSKETEDALQMAPFLNGDLFKEKKGYDNIGLTVPDQYIGDFFDFLFQYNFTIEENQYYDEDLELNPEFLGLIFERLVNKEDGAVYTPRTEVDFMCRMALVKWLEKNTSCEQRDLYRLFFREMGTGEEHDPEQKYGDFSQIEIKELIEKLENITACDPAAGSGAFEVGMMHVLYEVLSNLYNRPNCPQDVEAKSGFELKKAIIAQSLYGVEVKEWAVWINHLRLWLTLFIDMPDEEKSSLEPLLPSLNFKVRCGDSLVQRIGSKLFPVQGHAHLSINMKRRITNLKKKKIAFFNNKGVTKSDVEHAEFTLFSDIIREELDEKRQALRKLDEPKAEQGAFDLGVEPASSQQNIELNKDKKKKLQKEIDELEEQKQNLAENHPLIWSIEFAEIFYDKGGFDIIIGNPPYVRQEDISDPAGNLEPKIYKNKLKETAKMDFPDHFKGKVKISGRSDLYTYFYVRSLHLLNPDGMHVFICSNSWLDVGYGKWLQYFLLKNVPIHFVVDNHAKRSFAGADINTIITVLGAPEKKNGSSPPSGGWVRRPAAKNSPAATRPTANSAAGRGPITKFVAFKRPFEETILTGNLLDIERAGDTITNDKFRVFTTTDQRLLKEGSKFENLEDKKMGSGIFVGDKWGGKYLRAPDIFIKLLEAYDFLELGLVADIKTVSWSRKGFNSEIIIPKGSKLDNNDYIDLFKSPKDVSKIEISSKDTKYLLKLITEIENNIKYAPLLWGDLKHQKYICHICTSDIAFSHGFHGIEPKMIIY